ncbi:hypothetical protein GVN24_34085 [Rhizobium sp. CRIBSB]|nr:hypothetical protein [Rhizobium sp. CRIBSB]
MIAHPSAHLWRIVRWGLIAVILAIPAVAMRFTDQVRWTAFDFLAMAVLLGGAALVYELVLWKLPDPRHRLIAGAAVAAFVLIVWIEGAVGIFR